MATYRQSIWKANSTQARFLPLVYTYLEGGLTGDIRVEYTEFRHTIAGRRSFNSTDLEKYYQFGDAWNDPNYQSGTFRHKTPLMLLDLVK